MSALSVPYTYCYSNQSRYENGQIRLATFLPDVESPPHFFSGQLQDPRHVADLLRGLMNVVQSRFHVPVAMLGRILSEADPIVTCSDDRLRFEGFSACCGAYARVDLFPGEFVGQSFGRGTTNVDFNSTMLSALAMIRPTDRVTLDVGWEGVQLSRNADQILEKKVALPIRWLKGLVEVQATQSRMILTHEVNGNEAWRFLRSLPRMKTNRRETFVVEAGRGLRLSQIASRNSVRVGGMERLRVLEQLATDAITMRIYREEKTGATAWQLDFEQSRFLLVISPEVWRGFSGEGQILEAVATERWKPILPLVRAQLKWQSIIDVSRLLQTIDSSETTDEGLIQGALAALGAQGLVGYDLAEAAYFHRELPFDLEQIDKLHPRLRDARTLLSENAVSIGTRSLDYVEILVNSGGVCHRVRFVDNVIKCTCPWHARHGDSRGPCKHVLAAQIYLDESGNDDQF